MPIAPDASSAKIVEPLLRLPENWSDRTAFTASSGKLTFAQLREGMLRSAAWLGKRGVRPGDVVAVCLPKCLPAIQLIYGVFACGAVYAPLQFNGPPNRLNAIIASLRPRLVLTTAEMAARFAREGGGNQATNESLAALALAAGEIEQLASGLALPDSLPQRQPDELAAIYFTSGSTGQPKGVMWSRRAMAATVGRTLQHHQANADDRLISHIGFHYSPSMDIFYPLLSGCSAFVLTEREALVPEQVAAVIEHERTTMWVSSASLLRLLAEGGNLEQRELGAMRYVEFMGEPLAVPVLRRLMDAFPMARFLNNYGATEAYDIAHYRVPRPLPGDLANVPLGHPLGNYEFQLRSEDGSEAKYGESGEICVSGPQVMMGYWAEPEQTAARRIDGHPDSYRTGDYAYRDGDGILRMVGRKDNVVKVHGNRLDLGEVAAVLKKHPAVREAVVFAVATTAALGDKEVRAAIQVEGARVDNPALLNELRRLCRDSLPNFARPVRFAMLETFPLLSSGKIDRKALEQRLSAS
ncbi:MAG TPA: AMP-binding protein [Dongiaceae bacterium]